MWRNGLFREEELREKEKQKEDNYEAAPAQESVMPSAPAMALRPGGT